ncbi:response regulator transcription factor [Altererythrobacter sp. ZODW24]|uniref:helix-turn-helix transcriptional regulator n=1 Tax=Altererythrobacter sp. ZODW24 TaxID=2185142 RepID=UPI000DF7851F|nr:response regulator transcription factor [Altererythrobacter sp. ZODW24]
MRKTYLIYGIAVAACALLLDLMAYRHLVRQLPTDVYVMAVACVFVALGIWVGVVLTPRLVAEGFALNHKAIQSLGLTQRECDVLALLAKGEANKEIARSLGVSPNTVKTHVTNLYAKLGVTSRGRAVSAARELSLLP